jgi:hypothetical protein
MLDAALQSLVDAVGRAARRPGQRIYSVHVWFAVTVHVVPALGFTRFLPCKFVVAASEREAALCARQHFEGRGIPVARTEVSLALEQHVSRYVFPEQILVASPDTVEQLVTA